MTKITVPFTEQDKSSIIEAKKLEGYRLVEVQRHVDGSFLVFDNEPSKPEPLSLEQRIARLETEVTTLKVRRV